VFCCVRECFRMLGVFKRGHEHEQGG
jgi:hypothetical protein